MSANARVILFAAMIAILVTGCFFAYILNMASH